MHSEIAQCLYCGTSLIYINISAFTRNIEEDPKKKNNFNFLVPYVRTTMKGIIFAGFPANGNLKSVRILFYYLHK